MGAGSGRLAVLHKSRSHTLDECRRRAERPYLAVPRCIIHFLRVGLAARWPAEWHKGRRVATRQQALDMDFPPEHYFQTATQRIRQAQYLYIDKGATLWQV